MMLSLMIARIRVKTYSKAFGVFGDVKGIENRITLNKLKLLGYSPLSSGYRDLSKETRDLEKYRDAIVRVQSESSR